MKRKFPHFRPWNEFVWQQGDPKGLTEISHLGSLVWFRRYQQQDTLDPEFAKLTNEMIVNDPGGRYIGVSYIPGSRMVVIYAPSLSGDISMEKKLTSKLQKEMDQLINEDATVVTAKALCDRADGDWKASPELYERQMYERKAAIDKAYHDARSLVATPRIIKLRQAIENSAARITKARNRAHKAISDFATTFSYIVWPEFGSDRKMYKKKPGALPGWWRDKMSFMAHPSLRKRIKRGASFKSKVLVDPSEACSTMMCPNCGHLESQGTIISQLTRSI